jgi:hypothetical protein
MRLRQQKKMIYSTLIYPIILFTQYDLQAGTGLGEKAQRTAKRGDRIGKEQMAGD